MPRHPHAQVFGAVPHSIEAIRDFLANAARDIVKDLLRGDPAIAATVDTMLVELIAVLNEQLGADSQ